MGTSTTLRLIRQTAELEQICPAWQALWLVDPNATPIQHPSWLLPWWHSFGQPNLQPDLRVATLWQDGVLLALLPLYVLTQPAGGQLLLLGAGTSDYLDAVVSPDCTAEQLEDLLRGALREPGWAEAHFTQLRPGSRLRAAVETLRAEGLAATPYTGEPCSTCAASPVASLPHKLRADVRYFRNATLGLGKLLLQEAAADELGSTFDLLVRFHTERWQGRGEPGVLADPAVLRHHREALPALHAAGLLRLVRLELGGTPIAVLYSLIDPPTRPQRTQYLYLMGYAPEHSELRPGVLLTALCSERAAAEGVQTLDMLRGAESYKQFWRVEPRPTFGFAIQPPLEAE